MTDAGSSTDANTTNINLDVLGPNRTVVDLTVTNTVTHNLLAFNIVSVSVVPNVSASLYITFITDTTAILSRMVTLTGDDYAGWGSDDSYLTAYVAENISTIFNTP
jgi:hypothetical protein